MDGAFKSRAALLMVAGEQKEGRGLGENTNPSKACPSDLMTEFLLPDVTSSQPIQLQTHQLISLRDLAWFPLTG